MGAGGGSNYLDDYYVASGGYNNHTNTTPKPMWEQKPPEPSSEEESDPQEVWGVYKEQERETTSRRFMKWFKRLPLLQRIVVVFMPLSVIPMPFVFFLPDFWARICFWVGMTFFFIWSGGNILSLHLQYIKLRAERQEAFRRQGYRDTAR